MPLVVVSAGDQIDGKRDYQEDFYTIADKVILSGGVHCTLALLCDGMGGHVAGQIASRLACEVFHETFVSSSIPELNDRLLSSLTAANEAIEADSLDNPEREGMGTTLVATVIIDNLLHWISVGDSPLWLRRKDNLTRLNADHSLGPVLDKLADIGEITTEQAMNDSRRNQLRSVLIGQEIEHIDLPDESIVLRTDDDVVLASDGIETLSLEELTGQLCLDSFRNQRERILDLLEQVIQKDRPGQDNATVIILHCESENREPRSLLGAILSLFGWKP